LTGGGGEWTGGGGEWTGGGGGECTGGGGEWTGGGGEETGGGGDGEECTTFGVSAFGVWGLGDGVGFGSWLWLGLWPFSLPPQCLLQSTGRVSTGKHCFDDFWFFLPDKQLLESSKATNEFDEATQLWASPLK